ncbi:alkaline phosphatase family protein [Nesterenkonia alba]|uniref:alkaline phosphatase family protein n=1 Tax=Nesterenkonia alba TaxID=515814 RepID=UPI000402EDB0|nr:alkaline phosphatase family protein [Nesterenkonia alba]
MSRLPPWPAPPDYDGAHLRHVLPSTCAALGLEGFTNRLGVPQSNIAVVVLADGLGERNLAAHTGHARHLGAAWRSLQTARTLDCGVPATTATSLSSFGTGATPGEHGMLGYDLYAEHLDRVVNMLGGWDDDVDPATWQPVPSLLRQAQQAGAEVLTVSRSQFRDSQLTRAALQGGEFAGADRIEHRFRAAAEWITAQRQACGGVRRGPPTPLLVYLYVDELDKAGHEYGVASAQWRHRLESLDEAARRFCHSMRERFGDQITVLLTADHGMIDLPKTARTDISAREDLLTGVVHTAGDPRLVYLHTAAGAAGEVADRWQEAFGDQAWVLQREEAIAAGWFGPVTEAAAERIGDVVVAMYDDAGIFHTARTGREIASLVGFHGSLTETERKVPLLELTGRALG